MPSVPDVTILEHTADYFVEVKGKTLEDLFRAGLWAITSHCTDGKYRSDIDCVVYSLIEEQEDTLEDLFVSFLNEILYLMTETNGVYYRIDFDTLTTNTVQATIWGIDKKNVLQGGEIKAATYHDLTVEQQGDSWIARILFDV